MRVHVDDEGLPYYTIRLSSGLEKQTEGPRLRPLIASYPAHTTMRNDGTYDSGTINNNESKNAGKRSLKGKKRSQELLEC